MAAPVLREFPSVHVVSFEPSPAALKYLRRSVEASPFRERWRLVEKALSSAAGAKPFFTADEANSAYDGLANTRRGSGAASQTTVDCSTLDAEWIALGRPEVSVIKIDVEGAELSVLEGATECVGASRPSILLEWNRHNLLAHDVAIDSILRWAKEREYHLHSAETGALVTGPDALRWYMAFGENFLLFPARD
jgi:FkbM family methyltransferase